MTKRKKVLLGLHVALLLLVAAWFGGGFGWLVRHLILPRLAPRKVGSSFMIYSFEAGERFEHESRGITLILSPARAKEVVRGAVPKWSRWLPPGVLVNGFHIQCIWMPDDQKDNSMGVIPLWILVDRNAGYQPVLKGRMPVDEVNRYLAEDMAESLSKKEKWVFGSYRVIYKISFDEMKIISDTGMNVDEGRRALNILADGRVRIKFDDKPISARATGDVKELKAHVDLTFVPQDDAYSLVYEGKVSDLRMNVNNVLPLGDKKISEDLKEALEKSMNRSKNKKRAAKLRIPEWAPRDIIVDIKLSHPDEGGTEEQ